MDLENYFSLIVEDLKVNGIVIKCMDMVLYIIQAVSQHMKDNGFTINLKGMGPFIMRCHLCLVINLMEKILSKLISRKMINLILFQVVGLNMLEISKMIVNMDSELFT